MKRKLWFSIALAVIVSILLTTAALADNWVATFNSSLSGIYVRMTVGVGDNNGWGSMYFSTSEACVVATSIKYYYRDSGGTILGYRSASNSDDSGGPISASTVSKPANTYSAVTMNHGMVYYQSSSWDQTHSQSHP